MVVSVLRLGTTCYDCRKKRRISGRNEILPVRTEEGCLRSADASHQGTPRRNGFRRYLHGIHAVTRRERYQRRTSFSHGQCVPDQSLSVCMWVPLVSHGYHLCHRGTSMRTCRCPRGTMCRFMKGIQRRGFTRLFHMRILLRVLLVFGQFLVSGCNVGGNANIELLGEYFTEIIPDISCIYIRLS